MRTRSIPSRVKFDTRTSAARLTKSVHGERSRSVKDRSSGTVRCHCRDLNSVITPLWAQDHVSEYGVEKTTGTAAAGPAGDEDEEEDDRDEAEDEEEEVEEEDK